MNYEKIYTRLILNAIKRNEDHPEWSEKLYTENHHWFPKSLYPDYAREKWNIVKLTAREHFVAHKLLMLMLPNSKKMKQAFSAMCHHNKGKRRLKISSRDFSLAREIMAKVCREQFTGTSPQHMVGRVGLAANRKKLADIYFGDTLVATGVVITDWCNNNGMEQSRSNLNRTARGVRKSAKGYRAVYV